MKIEYFKNILFIFIFFVILLLPTIYTKLNIKTSFIINENRSLQKTPKLELENLKSYPKIFDKFYTDNYGFRQELILANQFILDDVLNVDSISNKVLVGKSNWLYTTEYGALKDYQGMLKYNPEILKKLLNLLIREYREAKKNGIKYAFVVVPDKHTIYPEFLPDKIQNNKTNNDILIEQLTKKLKAIEPDFPILDLRESLLEAKKDNIIYWQADTHWNEVGAYYGYRTIANFLNIKPLSLDNFNKIEKVKNDGNLASMINKEVEYIDYSLKYKNKPKFSLVVNKNTKEIYSKKWNLPLEKEYGRHSLLEYKNKNKKLPKLLMFRDSYTDHLKEFLPNHFSQSIFIWLYPCKIKFDLAKQQGVDILIRQVAETRVGLQISRCE
jgi:hypothetical protein